MISTHNTSNLRDFAIVLPITFLLTVLGLFFAWQQAEAPDLIRRTLVFVLIPPMAVLAALIKATSSDHNLSASAYRLVLVLGSVGQVLYYYAIFIFIRNHAVKILGRVRTKDH
jgi:hypothetical protein